MNRVISISGLFHRALSDKSLSICSEERIAVMFCVDIEKPHVRGKVLFPATLDT